MSRRILCVPDSYPPISPCDDVLGFCWFPRPVLVMSLCRGGGQQVGVWGMPPRPSWLHYGGRLFIFHDTSTHPDISVSHKPGVAVRS